MDDLAFASTRLLIFSGARREFRRLVTRGAGLEFITVGFYRFWLATDIRRHLWLHTSVDGDVFEYTGRGKELLIGLLFALAILVPVYLVYFLIGLEAERLSAFASLPLVGLLYIFAQFAIFRARRYRLTRTVWRGLRFWMTGSGWAYALRAALWGLLVPLTLGLILPWRTAALERYKMRHSYYGNLQGGFEGSGWQLFKRGWWLWLLAAIWLIAILMAVVTRGKSLIVLPLAPFLYAAYKATEWRWWLSGIRFGGMSLESTLERRALLGIYWKTIGWVVLLLALFTAYLSICVTAIGGVPPAQIFFLRSMTQSIPLLALAGVGYLSLALAVNVVMRIYLLRDLWATLAASTLVHGIEAVSDVAAGGELAGALGEGFADNLDVAGF